MQIKILSWDFFKKYMQIEKYWDQNSGVIIKSYSTADWLYFIDSTFEFALSSWDFLFNDIFYG